MTPRRLAPVLALTALALCSHVLPAKDGDLVFEFSTNPVEVTGGVPTAQPTNITLRPNTAKANYLYVRNKFNKTLSVIVEIWTEDGRDMLAKSEFALPQTEANLANPKAVLVKLAKPAPPMPAAPAAAPVPPAAVPPMPMAPPQPPPPPGIELKLTAKRDFAFQVRAYDDRGTGTINKDAASEKFDVTVTIQEPTGYIQPPAITYRKKGPETQLIADFKSTDAFSGTTPCPVDLVFPPQAALIISALHEGVFRRNVTKPGESIRLYTKNLPLRARTQENGKFYVHVDGVPRAFVYSHSFFLDTEGKDAKVEQLTAPAIRFMEADKPAPPAELVTRPRIVPVRVEADPGSLQKPSLELRVFRVPENTLVEKITRDTTRERRVWLDAGSMDGGLLVNAQVGDWTIPLNLRDYRGKYQLEAALIESNDDKATFRSGLTVDDTKPESLTLEILPGIDVKGGPPKHLRTKPLPVLVKATDPESKIVRVLVFFGRPGPDGKLPEGVVEAIPPRIPGEGWAAQVPLPPPPPPMVPPVVIPPEQKGVVDVTAVAVNAVGLTEQVTVRIQLIDPPTGGTIKGVVAMSPAGKGLPGVAVTIRDTADGKEKGATKTNDKGQFIMEDVPPGTYRVLAARPDSGVGTKGFEDVRVQAGKISEVRVILTRRP